jgi:asparagine synthetase B (glutamine-hydrolysing)
MPVYTAGMEGSPDLKYARKVAEVSGVRKSEIFQVVWTQEQAMAVLEETVKVMQSYNLALLSDMVVYACVRRAKEDGVTSSHD